MPALPRRERTFEIGRASTICEGDDLAVIACGETVAPAYEAAILLEEKGIHAEVISMHSIKPLDKPAVLQAAKKCRAMITVEEHSIHGGLGEACASLLMQNNVSVPLQIVGIPDEDTATGSQLVIFEHYGISGKGLFEKAIQLLNL